jgi:predicted RNase H-like nuclease
VSVVAGIDGYRRGWVAIVLRDGAFDAAVAAHGLAEIVARVPAAIIIGVDIPIGLPASGPRPADVEARRFVGPRRSSVFPTLPRAVWEAPDLASARRLHLQLSGRSVSAQTFALRERVLEADAVAQADPRLREVHPEVSFRALAGQPLPTPKSSWSGISLRRGLLLGAGIALPDDLGDAGSAGIDDVLDAAAVAWSAHRVAVGEAASFPQEPTAGPDGIAAAIWY